MRTTTLKALGTFALATWCFAAVAVDRYVSLTGGHIPPFTTWADAATNIQAAIDAASAGDTVWVTNGIYNTGGKVMAGDLTNRVALDKALRVQSVNGPAATFIQGQWDPTIPSSFGALRGPGLGAVRCAWLTNGATLVGFTLRSGATRTSSEIDGGGVLCSSSSALVVNCHIVNNTSARHGGGGYGGTFRNCAFVGNEAGGGGGGAAFCNLVNCTVTRNLCPASGGGAYSCNWSNCIVAMNSTWSAGTTWPNYLQSGPQTITYSCSSPLPSGIGNTSADPQLLADGTHLAATSPCRGTGSASFSSGTDIDGQNWANPPSMGADEWRSEPAIATQPKPRPAILTGQVRISALIVGQQPLSCFWSKDGSPLEDGAHYGDAHTTSLCVKAFGVEDAGAYQVRASNAFGMITSQVVQVSIHCVDAGGTTPGTPYANWGMAATSIQEAIEAAVEADVVLVTNGIYATGGKVWFGDLTNRVMGNKSILVTSVNGPNPTTIQGQWDLVGQTGTGAIRCVSLEAGAGLSGFTLLGGATRDNNGWDATINGGGVWCASTTAELANCVITNCLAFYAGGGAYSGLLNNCVVVSNSTRISVGGGVSSGVLSNCLVTGNASGGDGGGVYGSQVFNSWLVGNRTRNFGGGSFASGLYNCTITANSAQIGGGSRLDSLTNCIVFFNQASTSPNISGSKTAHTCSVPLPSGPGNTSSDPQLSDGFHLSAGSPCRGLGSSLYATGMDLEGDVWSNPPSMGCDEVVESALVGTLSVSIEAPQTTTLVNHSLTVIGRITGRASRLEWSFGDGPVVTNASYITAHAWTTPGDYPVTFTAFNTDNPDGISTNILVHVIPLETPILTSLGLSGTNFQFRFSTQTGANNAVEFATNLNSPIAWTTLRSLVSTGPVMTVTDTAATNDARFYRVRSQ